MPETVTHPTGGAEGRPAVPQEPAETAPCKNGRADPSDDFAVLPLIARLNARIEKAGLAYCHWKSNNAIDRSASGQNDLDLLVAPADVSAFTAILAECGFKQAARKYRWEAPAIVHFYGYDELADRMVHVHAHYQLIVGDDYSKNYHLPLESQYLRSCTSGDVFPVPSPEFELVVFVIRMMIKHFTWEMLLTGQGRLKAAERTEYDFLSRTADHRLAIDLAASHLPGVSAAQFERCLRALEPGSSLWSRLSAGSLLVGALRPHSRTPRMIEVPLKMQRRLYLSARWRLLGPGKRRKLAGGGAIVAVVGGDGSGKTTTVQAMSSWLGRYFETATVHLGKPRWSLTTGVVRSLLAAGRALRLYPYMRDAGGLDEEEVWFPGYPWLLREVLTTRDRATAYRRARRLADRGAVVISDRFPLKEVERMDGPRPWILEGNMHRPLVRWLARLQRRYHQRIAKPEVVLVLRVDPSVAVQRRPGAEEDFIRARAEEIWGADWSKAGVQVLDANQQHEAVLREAKKRVWSIL
jgi:thymidylate kinase